MNFISTFDELNKLYEEAVPAAEQQEKVEEALTEAAEDEEIEIVDEEDTAEEISEEDVPVEEPVVEDEPKQVIIECDKCGALVIKDEADIVVDDETDLVNVEEPCAFCEETKGYKIIGVVAPYTRDMEETDLEDAVVEEALLDVNLPVDVDVTANGNSVAVGGVA